jgi:filamin
MADHAQDAEPVRDRSWVAVQKKTFTRWSNNFLKDRKMHITDLTTDLATGINLINLLEIISAKEIGGRYNKTPKLAPQKLENVSLALKFIQQQGIKLVAIGPEDIVDGKEKLILGLIWTLILRFQIQRGGFEGKAELLEWVRKQVAPYGLRPNNFNVDWTDAKVLSALTDSLKPGVFPQDQWTGSPLNDLNTSIDTANKEYDIPKLMDAEDIHECPDELAMMTYISYFRDWALDDAKRRAAEIEAERLRKMRTADPSQCYAHGPGLQGGTTNNEAPFTIQAVNYFGDPLPTGGDQFVVALSGPNGEVPVKVVDNNNGTHSASYVPKDVGNYNLAITLRGDKIKESPWKPVVTGPSAKTSYAHGPGVEGARVRKAAPFTVQSVDQNGRNVPTGNDNFAVTVKDPSGAPVLVQFNDTKDGTYQGSYTPSHPGRYQVDITLDGQPIKNSPYHPLIENANAGKSYAEGDGLTHGQTKHPLTFTIHSVDADGNAVREGGDPFKVNITGPQEVTPKVTDNNDGTYSVEYQVEKPGKYTVNVDLHGEPIKDAPFHPTIKWSCAAGQTYADGEGVTDGKVFDNKPAQFTIHAVDHEGNPRVDGGDPFVVKIGGPQEPNIPHDIVDNNDGTYTVTYSPDKTGPIKVEVSLEGQLIKDAPFSIGVLAGTDPTRSNYKNFTVTVQARDKNGNVVVLPLDTLTCPQTNGTGANVTTNNNLNGTYTATLVLPTSGNYTFDPQLNGVSIGTSPFTIGF